MAKKRHNSPFMTHISPVKGVIYVGVIKSLKNVSYIVMSLKVIYDKKPTYTISQIGRL